MQFIGCDVAKNTLELAGPDRATLNAFNTHSGWVQLQQWIEHQWGLDRAEVCIVMEATCVYHLPLADYLDSAGFKVMVCNPGRSAEYARSQNQLNKNDRLDARSLQRYGARLEKYHWYQPNSPQINELKSLLLLLRQLDKDVRRWRNRLEKAAFLDPRTKANGSIKRQIRNLSNEQDRTQLAIDQLIQNTASLKRNQELMLSIKGVGPKTSQRLLPLLHDGRFNSARELAAFLGLVPCHKSSGTSLTSAGHLSGRGDKYLRSALYLPAITAAHKNPELKAFYDKLLSRGKSPKQAITAVMRKIVHLCYGVVKNQTPYIENYASLS
jgi:transposase